MMNLAEFLDGIRWNREWEIEFSLIEENYEQKKDLFYHSKEEFFKEVNKIAKKEEWALAFYIKLALEVWEFYEKKGIDKTIFFDTFYDLTLWTKDCFKKNGIIGLKEISWIGQLMNLEVIRLGRLEFEPGLCKENLKFSKGELKKGDAVIYIHIPAGEALESLACQASLEKAKEFFGNEKIHFLCHSWLLDTHLHEILEPPSHIIDFQEFFEIISIDYDFPQSEARIFGAVLNEKEGYPTKTRLQRKAKDYLVKGSRLGMGLGILKV